MQTIGMEADGGGVSNSEEFFKKGCRVLLEQKNERCGGVTHTAMNLKDVGICSYKGTLIPLYELEDIPVDEWNRMAKTKNAAIHSGNYQNGADVVTENKGGASQ